MKIGIIYSQYLSDIQGWVNACKKRSLDYVSIDLCCSDWFEQIVNSGADFLVNKPEGSYEYLKTMYDEKLYIITNYLKIPMFPSLEETLIYENKKMLSYFLKANAIPHPETNVFYIKQQALDFVSGCSFPIVAKTAIGASGSGVKIIKTKEEAMKYIHSAFSKKGINRRIGPNPNHGTPVSWLKKAMKDPGYLIRKVQLYKSEYKFGKQFNYVLFQAYIKHDFEYRVTKCGEYYYTTKKLPVNGKCSGAGVFSYTPEVPLEVYNFVKDICDKHNFNSMSADIFCTESGYLINELQTHWGVEDDETMYVNGAKGVYKYNNGWRFIKGDFWTNCYFDTRLDAAIELFNKRIL